MVLLKHLDDQKLLISKFQSLTLYDASADTMLDIELPVFKNTQGENENITRITTSKCGSYFAILRNKQVIIYNSSLEVVKEFTLKRAAHSITLFGGYNTLVADKTGDVYLYKISDGKQTDGTLLLGHLSMLLDVILSDDEKFLITCDRDEKIRVSHYPNTYNIKQFCLGHDEFVTKIVILENTYLLSASGDGKIIVWDYLKGNILHIINTSNYINDKTIINNFIEHMEQDKCEARCLPIMDMQIKKADTFYYVIVQLYKLKCLQIYGLHITNNAFNSKLIENICFETEIETFSLNQELFVATGKGVSMFTISDNTVTRVHKESLGNFKVTNEQSSVYDISTLYKRKFDNVQEYLERKRQRMEGK